MKNTSLFKFLFVFALVMVASCSKSEDPIKPAEADLELMLESDSGVDVLSLNELVNFTVSGNDGEDYTTLAKIFINDTEIDNPYYTFSSTGTFEVKAVHENVTSNLLNFDVIADTERVLRVSTSKALRQQTVTFTLLDVNGEDTSADADFYVNGSAITGNTFLSANVGDFEVYADYQVAGEDYSSEIKNFEVFIPKRKVVIEDYTGTWCGFCPKVVLAIEAVEAVTHDVAIVAIHKTAGSLPDPMDFPEITVLQDAFGIPNGFPKAQINRTNNWAEPFEVAEVTDMAGTDTNVSIAINSQLEGDNLTVDVKVIYEAGSESGDKLVVYLVESGIIYPQTNYFDTIVGHPYYGLGNPIPDYEHNDALRNSLSYVLGDAISATPAFNEFTKSYSLTIPSEYNPENLSIVAMVVKADNEAKNAQTADVNENKNYE